MSNMQQNWSGSVRFSPRQVAYPSTEEEVVALVKAARAQGHKVRVVGAAHSFTPVIQTDDVLVSLDRMSGLISADSETRRAIVWAGTRLRAALEALFAHGLAMENQGDIDVQSIAGALSTSTHGTGQRFGTLATQLRGVTFVDGQGQLRTVTAEANPDEFPALQISLGTCGIITRLELQCVPAYKLQYIAKKAKLRDVLADLETYKQRNRNFEFYWFPYTETVQTKESNASEEPPKARGIGKWMNDMVLENGVFSVLSNISRFVPGSSATVSKICAAGVSAGRDVNWAYKVYATPRLVRFHEMEYNIPQEHFAEALLEIDALIRKERFRVHFPLECRWVAPDDIYLSPAHQRHSAYIAVHMYRGMPHEAYFKALENVLRKYQGRPHWGKMHTLTAAELAPLYPRWDDFQRVRKACDPDGIFTSPYIRKVLGE